MGKQKVLTSRERRAEDLESQRLLHELYVQAKLDWAESSAARNHVLGQDEAVVRGQRSDDDERP